MFQEDKTARHHRHRLYRDVLRGHVGEHLIPPREHRLVKRHANGGIHRGTTWTPHRVLVEQMDLRADVIHFSVDRAEKTQ